MSRWIRGTWYHRVSRTQYQYLGLSTSIWAVQEKELADLYYPLILTRTNVDHVGLIPRTFGKVQEQVQGFLVPLPVLARKRDVFLYYPGVCISEPG